MQGDLRAVVIFLIVVMGIFMADVIYIGIRMFIKYRRQASEKKRLEELYAKAEAQKNELESIVSEGSVKDEAVHEAILKRLSVLDGILASKLIGSEQSYRSSEKELSGLWRTRTVSWSPRGFVFPEAILHSSSILKVAASRSGNAAIAACMRWVCAARMSEILSIFPGTTISTAPCGVSSGWAAGIPILAYILKDWQIPVPYGRDRDRSMDRIPLKRILLKRNDNCSISPRLDGAVVTDYGCEGRKIECRKIMNIYGTEILYDKIR